MVKPLSQIVHRVIIDTYRTDICIERDAYTGDSTDAVKLLGNCFRYYLFPKPG